MYPTTFTVHALERWEERIIPESFVKAWKRAIPYGIETRGSRYKFDEKTDSVFVISKQDNVVVTVLTRSQYMANAQMAFSCSGRITNTATIKPVVKAEPPQPPSEKTLKKLITNDINQYMKRFIIGRGIVNTSKGLKETKKKLREMLAQKGYDIGKGYVGLIINEAIIAEEKRMRNSIMASLKSE